MLFRLLLLAAAAFVVWRLFKTFAAPDALRRGPPAGEFEPMQRCARCGTYLPAKALSRDGLCGACKQ